MAQYVRDWIDNNLTEAEAKEALKEIDLLLDDSPTGIIVFRRGDFSNILITALDIPRYEPID